MFPLPQSGSTQLQRPLRPEGLQSVSPTSSLANSSSLKHLLLHLRPLPVWPHAGTHAITALSQPDDGLCELDSETWAQFPGSPYCNHRSITPTPKCICKVVFLTEGLKELNKGSSQLTEVMVGTENILAVLSDNDQGSTEAPGPLRPQKLKAGPEERKGRREGGKDRSSKLARSSHQ